MKQGEIKSLILAPKVSPHDSCPETWCWQRDEVFLVVLLLYTSIPYAHNPYYYNPSIFPSNSLAHIMLLMGLEECYLADSKYYN